MIRRATVEDAAAIARVHVASWRAAYRGILPDAVLDGLSVEARAERWAGWLAGGAEVYVLDLSPIGGFASLKPEDGGGTTLAALYLDPALWGRGHGAALLRAALATAPRPVQLWVFAANARAREFYAAHGFALDGRRKLDVHGVEDVGMTLTGTLTRSRSSPSSSGSAGSPSRP